MIWGDTEMWQMLVGPVCSAVNLSSKRKETSSSSFLAMTSPSCSLYGQMDPEPTFTSVSGSWALSPAFQVGGLVHSLQVLQDCEEQLLCKYGVPLVNLDTICYWEETSPSHESASKSKPLKSDGRRSTSLAMLQEYLTGSMRQNQTLGDRQQAQAPPTHCAPFLTLCISLTHLLTH